jgi:cell division protease FtsH
MQDLDKAKDKIMMGAERRSMVMDDAEKKLTAYREAGYAIVGLMVPEHDPVYKVSIIPRGRALGVTMFLPEQDRYSHSKRRLESQLASLFGGRVAEELIFGEDHVTTGASNDIMRATEIARKMVTSWGLSSMGPLTFGQEEGEVFLGRSVSQNKEVSDQTARQIDDEVHAIVDRNFQHAKQILTENIGILHLMAEGLIKFETIDANQIKEIMAGKPPSPPDDWESLKALDLEKENKIKQADEAADAKKKADDHSAGNDTTSGHSEKNNMADDSTGE